MDTKVEALAASTGSSPNNSNGEIPRLPPPDPDSNLPSIRLGETIQLEEMGPIILNTDGTTRRIVNWDNMTEEEKKVTWRRIRKRNEDRRQQLLQQQKEEIRLKQQQQPSEEGKNEEL